MTKPIRVEHLQGCVDWWGGNAREGRVETELAWKVTTDEVKERGYNLDIKNPHVAVEDHGDPEQLLAELDAAEADVERFDPAEGQPRRGAAALSAERLFAEFERLSEAPEAVSRLRIFIRQLAVRGSFAGTAVQVFDDHRRDAPIETDDDVEAVRPGWLSVRVDEVAQCRLGKMLDRAKNRGQPRRYLRNVNVRWQDFELDDVKEMPFEDSELAEFGLRRGDVLVCEGGEPGRSAVWDEREEGILFQKAIHRVRLARHVDPAFFVLSLREASESGRLARCFTGTTFKHLTGAGLAAFTFRIPPLVEQQRIVAKVAELMARCDELEAAQAEQERRRDQLAAVSLRTITSHDAAASHASAATFHLRHLHRTNTCHDHVAALRDAVRGLAVVGRLAGRTTHVADAADELHDVDLKKTKAALRKPKPVAPITPDEEWAELPSGWVWARWDQITDWITYGFTRPMEHVEGGVPIVTGKNVVGGRIDFTTAQRTPAHAFDALNPKDKPRRNDILLTKDGSIGRTAIVDTDQPFCINQSVAVLWLRSCHFDRRYLQLAIDCPQTQQALNAKTEGVAVKHISIIDFGRMVFPSLPSPSRRASS